MRFIFLLLFVSACSSNAEKPKVTEEKIIEILDESFFDQTWVHLREEDSKFNAMVFRPSDYENIPPSRFRQAYKFNKDGTCEYLYLAPNDGHTMKSANWKLDSGVYLISDNIEGQINEIFEFEILECGSDLMLVREKYN